jgi:hypothetical protein
LTYVGFGALFYFQQNDLPCAIAMREAIPADVGIKSPSPDQTTACLVDFCDSANQPP